MNIGNCRKDVVRDIINAEDYFNENPMEGQHYVSFNDEGQFVRKPWDTGAQDEKFWKKLKDRMVEESTPLHFQKIIDDSLMHWKKQGNDVYTRHALHLLAQDLKEVCKTSTEDCCIELIRDYAEKNCGILKCLFIGQHEYSYIRVKRNLKKLEEQGIDIVITKLNSWLNSILKCNI